MRRFFSFAAAVLSILFLAPRLWSSPLTARDLYDAALKHNTELMALRGEKDASLLQVKKARLERLPTLGFQTALSYIANPPSLDLKPGDLGSMQSPLGTMQFPSEKMSINLGAQSTNYSFTLILDQPLFTWGKISGAIDLFRESSVVKTLAIESKERELKAKITIFLYSLRFIIRMEDLLKEQSERGDRLVYISDQFYKNEIFLLSQLIETKMQVNEVDLAKSRLKARKNQLLLELSQACGIPQLSMENIDLAVLDDDVKNFPIPDPAVIKADARKNNADLKQLDQLKIIASKKRDITRAGAMFKPDLGIHLELSYGGPLFPFVEADWFAQDDYNFTATLGVKAGIFDGGRVKTAQKADETDIRQAFYQYDNALTKIDYAVGKAALEMASALDIIAYYDQKIDNQKERANLLQKQFDAGATMETDLLSAEIEIYAAMIERIQHYITYFTNYFALELIGGRRP